MNFDVVTDGPAVLSVSALNQSVARLLERSFPLTWVSGEISNFTRAASGHWYFTLKDEGAQVRAVMFRGRAQYADFVPREGDKVEVRALVSIYAARGDYQLGVEAIRRAGLGNLYEAFLKLKAKLEAEGLFASSTKRRIPVFARTIGVVTSPQAAALRDILSTLQRRSPHCHVVIYPTPVQGTGAADKIAQAITKAGERADCDVLLVCRGGGSIEDLWAFNEEVVARAVASCPIPVISGVGHETDVTIIDFAADLRAPTPTAAAELAAQPRIDWIAHLHAQALKVLQAWQRQRNERAQNLDWMMRRLVSPSMHIAHQRLKLDALQQQLHHALRIPVTEARHATARLQARLRAAVPSVVEPRFRLNSHARRLTVQVAAHNLHRRQLLNNLFSHLEMLAPQRTLERGYAIVTDKNGTILRTPKSLRLHDPIDIRLADGSARISLEAVQRTLE